MRSTRWAVPAKGGCHLFRTPGADAHRGRGLDADRRPDGGHGTWRWGQPRDPASRPATGAIGQSLASDLVAEIIATAYEDPNDDPGFGPEGVEGAGPRSGFDDVDDYNGWSSQPPKYRDGTTIPNREDWRRQVTVQFVQPNSPNLPTVGSADEAPSESTVVVQYHDQDIAEQSVIRTDTE